MKDDLFEEDIIGTHGDQENASYYTKCHTIFQEAGYNFRKSIADENQYQVAEPNTRNKAEASFLTVVEALLNITGPTEIAKIIPSVSPLIIACDIIKEGKN